MKSIFVRALALLGCYAAYVDSLLPTFRYNLHSQAKKNSSRTTSASRIFYWNGVRADTEAIYNLFDFNNCYKNHFISIAVI